MKTVEITLKVPAAWYSAISYFLARAVAMVPMLAPGAGITWKWGPDARE